MENILIAVFYMLRTENKKYYYIFKKYCDFYLIS